MSQKLGHRPEEAADVIGSRELLENMRRAGWIAPIYEEKRLTIYSYAALCKCFARLERGERPPKRDRSQK